MIVFVEKLVEGMTDKEIGVLGENLPLAVLATTDTALDLPRTRTRVPPVGSRPLTARATAQSAWRVSFLSRGL
jgi:hypothetical protein